MIVQSRRTVRLIRSAIAVATERLRNSSTYFMAVISHKSKREPHASNPRTPEDHQNPQALKAYHPKRSDLFAGHDTQTVPVSAERMGLAHSTLELEGREQMLTESCRQGSAIDLGRNDHSGRY